MLNRWTDIAWWPHSRRARLGILEEVTARARVFPQQRAVEFWGPAFLLVRAFRGIKDLQTGIWSSQLQCCKATSRSKTSPLHSQDLRRGCPSHLFPFQCDWSQNSISKRSLQIQNWRRQWFNKLQNKSKRDLWKCPLFFPEVKEKKKACNQRKESLLSLQKYWDQQLFMTL